jgi:hypothetical protein
MPYNFAEEIVSMDFAANFYRLEDASESFSVTYELGFYIPEDGILHSHRRENHKSYIALTGWTL